MRTILICFLILTCAAGLCAAPGGKGNKKAIPADVPKQFSSLETVWLKSKLSEEFLLARAKAIASEFARGKNGKMLTVPECRSRTRELQRFAKYYFMEVDSGLSKTWVQRMIKYTEALTQAQEKIQYFIMNNQTGTDEYRQWYDYYTKNSKQYWNIAQKPIRILDRKKLAELGRIKKAVIERELASEQTKLEKAPKLDEKKLKKR